MRTKSVVKNTSVAIFASIILALFKFVLRKVFLLNFDISLLGYEGLFTSIFTVLSIAEMGAGSIFGYMLYKAVSVNDAVEESIVMSMLKKIYSIIGLFVLIMGIIVFAFLKCFIQDNNYDIAYIRIVYLIQLFTTLITYFLAYKRGLLYAMQKSYIVVFYSTICEIIGCIARIVLIIILKNYIVYILIPLFTNLSINLLISNYCRVNYNDVVEKRIGWDIFRERKVFVQLKSLLVTKISTVLYTTSDSIIISIMISVKAMGLYSNYLQFVNIGKTLLSYFAEPLGHSVGNLVYTEDINKRTSLYRCVDLLGTYIGVFSFIISVCIFQRVIILFFGIEYLLSKLVVIAISLDFYVRCRGLAYNAYRGTVGHYEETRMLDAMAAISNIIFSILLGLKFGIEGILFATIIGNVLIQTGRAKITFKYLVGVNAIFEIFKEIYNLIILGLIFLVASYVTNKFEYNLIGLLYTIICSVIILTIFLFVFTYRMYKKSNFNMYGKEVILVLSNKLMNKR